jgi:hypothetical protein
MKVIIKNNIYAMYFSPEKEIANLENFCDVLVHEPEVSDFVGFINKINDTHYLLNALHLSTCDTLDIEVYQDEILINLHDDSENDDAVLALFEYCKKIVDNDVQLEHCGKEEIEIEME